MYVYQLPMKNANITYYKCANKCVLKLHLKKKKKEHSVCL